MRTYATEDAAIRAVFMSARYHGIWPGYQRTAEGRFALTAEPDELSFTVGGPDSDGDSDTGDGNDGYGPWLDDASPEAA
jgi:hypothetical protein